jgi:predicted PurR-regulated permease PerM
MDRPAGTSSRRVTVIGSIAIISALYFARGLLLPLAMAALVSLLLAPLVGRVERWGQTSSVPQPTAIVQAGS